MSPFISPAEKEVRDMAIREGAPIILVAPQGFRMREHAKGRAFDLCAEGRLLVISRPGVYAGTGVLTRRECLEMNDLASTIAETDYNRLHRAVGAAAFGLRPQLPTGATAFGLCPQLPTGDRRYSCRAGRCRPFRFKVMIIDILLFLAGLALLVAGGNYLTDGAGAIARRRHHADGLLRRIHGIPRLQVDFPGVDADDSPIFANFVQKSRICTISSI